MSVTRPVDGALLPTSGGVLGGPPRRQSSTSIESGRRLLPPPVPLRAPWPLPVPGPNHFSHGVAYHAISHGPQVSNGAWRSCQSRLHQRIATLRSTSNDLEGRSTPRAPRRRPGAAAVHQHYVHRALVTSPQRTTRRRLAWGGGCLRVMPGRELYRVNRCRRSRAWRNSCLRGRRTSTQFRAQGLWDCTSSTSGLAAPRGRAVNIGAMSATHPLGTEWRRRALSLTACRQRSR